MAISSDRNRVTYSGDGSSTIFNYQYQFHADAELGVTIYNSSRATVISAQALTTNYTISGTKDAQGRYLNGANVIINSAPATGDEIVIFRSSAVNSTFDLGFNQTIPRPDLIKALDRFTMLAQRLNDQTTRALMLQDAYPYTFDPRLPAKLTAGSPIIINSGGIGIALGLVTGSSSFIGILPMVNGGTGANLTPTRYGVIYADSTTTLNYTGQGGDDVPFIGQGAAAPAFEALNLASGSAVTGVLRSSNGGTGTGSTLTQGRVVFIGTSAILTESANFVWANGSSRLLPNIINLAQGTAALPALTFALNTDTGIYHAGSNVIGVAAGAQRGLEVRKSSGNFANIGIGADASSVDNYPLLIERNQAANTVMQIINASGDSSANSMLEFRADTGSSNTAQIAIWPNAQSTHAYQNRLSLRSIDSLKGISLIGNASDHDVRVYLGGLTAADESIRFNPDYSLQFMRARTSAATAGVGSSSKIYFKTDGIPYLFNSSKPESYFLIANSTLTEGRALFVGSGRIITEASTLGANSAVFTDAAGRLQATGVLPIAQGGTANSSFTQYALLFAQTTSKIGEIPSALSGRVLQANGSSAPTWEVNTETPTATTDINTTYTATTSNRTIFCNGSSAYSVNLYDATGNSGRQLNVIRTAANSSIITIFGSGTQTINGTSFVLASLGQIANLVSDGTNWFTYTHETRAKTYQLGRTTRFVSGRFSVAASAVTIVNQIGGAWINSITFNSAGNYTFNINSGVFSSSSAVNAVGVTMETVANGAIVDVLSPNTANMIVKVRDMAGNFIGDESFMLMVTGEIYADR